MRCQFSSFDELWQRYLTGEGPPGPYMAGLSTDRRETLKRAMRQNVLSDGPTDHLHLMRKRGQCVVSCLKDEARLTIRQTARDQMESKIAS
jgi:hypothetical protein